MNLPAPSKRVSEFLAKSRASRRGRVAFVIDATGSRERAWDMAAQLQTEMFREAAAFGTLDLQLTYFRGMPGVDGECRTSPWTGDGAEMARLMSKITCRTGPTQIEKALRHVRSEHQHEPIAAATCVGDMCEELPQAIYDAAAALGRPCFVFQEGNDPFATPIFREVARLTRGAYARFDPGAATQLRELLRAVAAFATGGLTALENMKGEAATRLLRQMK
jgi:hypothetical protein